MPGGGLSDQAMMDADFVLKDRGVSQALEEFIVGAAFARTGGAAAFAMGDGTMRIAPPAGEWIAAPAHDGAILAMAAAPGGWVTGGDDGRFCRTAPDGAVTEIARFGSKWVEQVAAWTDGKTGLLACSVGKVIHLFDGGGRKLKELAHPSTVSGIAIDAKGKRVAASHYNGATLWFVAAKVDSPRSLEWKGSHIGVAIHPGGDAVVTSMQENALHGWRLADGQHMRMSGYPSKTESLSFSRTGKWLATSGAESIVLWPFFGGGPMGKAPTELAGGDTVTCNRVAFHPQQDMVAAGFSDGLVIVADVGTERVLPMAAPGRGGVSALAWSPDGTRLAFGTETGFAALVDLSKR
jgi:WD40 repeat protein